VGQVSGCNPSVKRSHDPYPRIGEVDALQQRKLSCFSASLSNTATNFQVAMLHRSIQASPATGTIRPERSTMVSAASI
jgi:hypothetical protein